MVEMVRYLPSRSVHRLSRRVVSPVYLPLPFSLSSKPGNLGSGQAHSGSLSVGKTLVQRQSTRRYFHTPDTATFDLEKPLLSPPPGVFFIHVNSRIR